MGTLHVCFADLPQYGNNTEANAVAVGTTTTMTLQPAHHQQQQQQQLQQCTKEATAVTRCNSISPTPRYERNMSFFQQLSRRFGLRSHDDPVYSAAEEDSTDSCSSTTTATMPSLSADANAGTVTVTVNAAMTTSLCNNNNNSNSNGNSLRAKDGHGSSNEHISCASSETSSTVDAEEQQPQSEQQSTKSNGSSSSGSVNTSGNASLVKERRSSARASFSRLHRRSTNSIRRAFESFSLSSRSLSCSGVTPPPQYAASAGSSGSTPIKSALKCSSTVELSKRTNGAATATAAVAAGTKSKTKPPPQRILRQPVSYTYLKGISGLPTQRVPRSSVCCQYARR